MYELFVTAVLTWYFCGAFDCILHTLAHLNWNVPWIKGIHDIHMNHHKLRYPIGELLKPAPYLSGNGTQAFLPPIMFITFGASYLLHCIGFSNAAVCLFIVESA